MFSCSCSTGEATTFAVPTLIRDVSSSANLIDTSTDPSESGTNVNQADGSSSDTLQVRGAAAEGVHATICEAEEARRTASVESGVAEMFKFLEETAVLQLMLLRSWTRTCTKRSSS